MAGPPVHAGRAIPLLPLGAAENHIYVPKDDTRSSGTVYQVITGIIPVRYMFSFLSAVSFAIIYGLKVNVSVAIVTMVNQTALNVNKGKQETETKSQDGPFIWSESTQGIILGSYFWGYLFGQLPGGRLSEAYSAKVVMLVAVILNVIGCSLTPTACFAHYYAFIGLRVIQGFGAGLTFPAMHVLISRWAPLTERNVITAVIYAGTSLGTVISMIMTGNISAAIGWEWSFYIMAIMSSVWCFLWIWLVTDFPEDHAYISPSEKAFITDSLGDTDRERFATPWTAMLTSVPFIAICVSHFFGNCSWYLILTQIPTFMRLILKFEIKKNAFLSALPYLTLWLFTIILSRTLDYLREKGRLSTGAARKISTTLSALPPAACFIGLGFTADNALLAVILMTIGITFMGAMFCGYLANHIDLSPNFVGTMMGISNTFATFPGIFVPLLVGLYTQGNQTIERWRTIFICAAVGNIFHGVVYIIFASGEVQPWNKG